MGIFLILKPEVCFSFSMKMHDDLRQFAIKGAILASYCHRLTRIPRATTAEKGRERRLRRVVWCRRGGGRAENGMLRLRLQRLELRLRGLRTLRLRLRLRRRRRGKAKGRPRAERAGAGRGHFRRGCGR